MKFAHAHIHLSDSSCSIYVLLRWMYWTDYGSPAKIERASMDGTSRMILHNTTLMAPSGLTVDYPTQNIYWIDYTLDRLEMSNTNGSNRVLLTVLNIVQPFDITFYRPSLYWSDINSRRILTVSPESAVNSASFLSSTLSYNPYGIKVIAQSRQPEGTMLYHKACHKIKY